MKKNDQAKEEQMHQHIEACNKSGLTVSDYCAQNGIVKSPYSASIWTNDINKVKNTQEPGASVSPYSASIWTNDINKVKNTQEPGASVSLVPIKKQSNQPPIYMQKIILMSVLLISITAAGVLNSDKNVDECDATKAQ